MSTKVLVASLNDSVWPLSVKAARCSDCFNIGVNGACFQTVFPRGHQRVSLVLYTRPVTDWKIEKKRAQTPLSLVSLHSWPITAWSGWEVQVVVTESKRKCWNNTSESSSAEANCQLDRWFCPTDVLSQTSSFHTPRSKRLDVCHTPAIYKSLRRFSYFYDQNALSGWSPL